MSGRTEQPAAACLQDLAGTLHPEVVQILDRALYGEDITAEEATVLFGTTGPEYNAMVLAADELRRRTVGDVVTYVVNRNINFTNVCIKRCGFCAFSRDFREEEGYYLPIEEIVRRAQEAWDYGATEVCIQAGLPPQMEGDLYIRLCAAIKDALPDIHIHGFSPEEVHVAKLPPAALREGEKLFRAVWGNHHARRGNGTPASAQLEWLPS